ncbi:MAG: YdcF family protein [Cyanobacteria bacterium P01_F01_bin.116]
MFLSGINDAPIMMELAQKLGVPNASISGEGCSTTTWENAFYTKQLLPVNTSSSVKPTIILITDDLHIVRPTYVYQSFGFEVIPYSVDLQFVKMASIGFS